MFAQEIQPFINFYLQTLDKSKITDVISYSTKGGKCLRGFIVKEIIETMGVCDECDEWAPIVAVELIHAASLIIDDLPCMDNDDTRRGKPSVFKAFGKHEAILASLYIISESMRILFDALNKNNNHNISVLIKEWSNLLSKNLVIGQMMDLNCNINDWFNINIGNRSDDLVKYKTGALFSFSFLVGALFSSTKNFEDFKNMGIHLGFMFQIMDDYKDRHTDIVDANYILTCGMNASIHKYAIARTNFIVLLKKYNLYTPNFIKMISAIDGKFKPLQSYISTVEVQNC